MTDDEFEPFGILFGFLAFVITLAIDLLVFAIELSIGALVLFLTLVWGIVCLVLDIKENE
jgi:hypothetical protein